MALTLPRFHVSEQLLITTLRLFAQAWREQAVGDPHWSGGLRAVGLSAGSVGACGSLFSTVATACHRPLDVRGMNCFCVGKDEVAFLRLMSLLQRRQADDAREILESWLPPSATRIALADAQTLATALRQRALVLPLRHAEAVVTYQSNFADANAGLTLVH
jgi:hypothetical protein